MKTLCKWLEVSKLEVIEFQIPSRGIALAVLAKPDSPATPQRSRLCLINEAELFELFKHSTRDSLLDLLKSSGLDIFQVSEIRLLGEKKNIAELGKRLETTGVKVGKSVELVTPFPLTHFLPIEGRLRIQRQAQEQRRLKVLIVDDSETIRTLLTRVISQDPGLECVGAIGQPSQVEAAIRQLNPDVLTLDIHMPEMNGVQLLKMLLPKFGLPAVMISSLSMEEGSFVLDALEAGAVDYIQKPSLHELNNVAPIICEKIKNAGLAKVQFKPIKKSVVSNGVMDRSRLILIGSSTGGTEALKQVLTSLPPSIPPVLIVQHIPAVFSKAFAERMNLLCPFEIKEAEDNDLVTPDRVLIAPGGLQMRVLERQGQLRVKIEDSEPVNRHKPSVDVLFESAVHLKGVQCVAGILTGMGADGARGLLALRSLGARTLAQNEATCVVYGMPKEAVKTGAVEKIVALEDIASTLVDFCQKGTKGPSLPIQSQLGAKLKFG